MCLGKYLKILIFKLSLILFFSACSVSDEEIVMEESFPTTTIDVTTTLKETVNFELPYKHYFLELENCKDFLGSMHNISCNNEPNIIKLFQFDSPIVNITKSRGRLFAISKYGLFYELDLKNNEFEAILDIQGQVYLESLESGALSFYLHPFEDEFLISYVNKNNDLIFELFYFEEDLKNILTSKILLTVPVFSRSHYSGGIFWSNYFQSYMVSIGDGVEANFESRLNHMPLDNNTLYGKIIALSSKQEEISVNNLILSNKNQNLNKNIIASGLRNPWQFFEFKDYLIIADTGFTQNEELNIFKYSDSTPSFGWPVFEATKRSQDLDNIDNYSLDAEIYHWDNGKKNNGLNFVEQNSIMPPFYYNHHPCFSQENENCYGKTDLLRAAIIGGDIISDVSSNYNFDIVFADYLSEELFAFNLINQDLKIFPIPEVLSITSVRANYGNNDEIIISSYDGSVYLIELP